MDGQSRIRERLFEHLEQLEHLEHQNAHIPVYHNSYHTGQNVQVRRLPRNWG